MREIAHFSTRLRATAAFFVAHKIAKNGILLRDR